LIKDSENGTVEPSNPIYAEVIVRALNYSLQDSIKLERPDDNLPKYLKGGRIDIDTLLREFQSFWRENSEIWIKRYKENFYQYDEAAPHLVIQAFLQRVLNGGGHISREMALGKKRADICIEWQGQRYVSCTPFIVQSPFNFSPRSLFCKKQCHISIYSRWHNLHFPTLCNIIFHLSAAMLHPLLRQFL